MAQAQKPKDDPFAQWRVTTSAAPTAPGAAPAGDDAFSQWKAAPSAPPPQQPAPDTSIIGAEPPSPDLLIGAAKGAGQTLVNLGELWHKVPGVRPAIDKIYDAMGLPGTSAGAFAEANRAVTPTNTTQKIGKGAEQVGEFFVPGSKVSQATKGLGVLPRMAAEGALGGSMAEVQGTDPATGVVVGAAGPALGVPAQWVGKKLADTGVSLMRAGLKTPLAIIKQQAGVGAEGLNFGATKLAKYMVDNKIATVKEARDIFNAAEADVQSIIAANPGVITDAPQRAMLYLTKLRDKAVKSLVPDQAHAVTAYIDELIQHSPLGETVATTVMKPTATGMAPTTQLSRVLRPGLPAEDALQIARNTGLLQTNRQWGEMKGVAMEGVKTAERAVRDAFKEALPATKTPLQQEGMAILAKKVLDRRELMEGNRDAVSLPGLVGANINAVVGLAAHWLRNNQRRAGIYAGQLARAIESNDGATAAAILHRLGVGVAGQATKTDIDLPAK